MSVFKDEYMLGQSKTKSITGIAEAIRIDLSLNPNPHLNAGTVTGRVSDTLGNAISDAAVIILDENYTILANTITGSDGIYIFSPLEPGSGYRAYSQAPGFSLSEAPVFDLNPNQTMEVNFTLIADTATVKSIIAGEVQNPYGFPINSASIELYKVEETATKLICLSFSNEVGQFVIRDLEQGSYFLKINAQGYFSSFYPADITQSRAIITVDAVLKEDLKASKGIVTGLITDSEDQPLANADVILYRIGIDKSQTPVAYTRTNHEGIYLFVNVPQGEYRVNSNRSIILE